MKTKILFALVMTVAAATAASQLTACDSGTTDMPKNDSGPGSDAPNPGIDSGSDVSNDYFVPDSGNACDKGIKYDNTKLPGWPNIPTPP